MKILIEATSVGVLLVLGSMVLPKCPSAFEMFILGFLFHVLCEIAGVNRWYCKNGVACKKLV
jgi:hypothetical protein